MVILRCEVCSSIFWRPFFIGSQTKVDMLGFRVFLHRLQYSCHHRLAPKAKFSDIMTLLFLYFTVKDDIRMHCIKQLCYSSSLVSQQVICGSSQVRWGRWTWAAPCLTSGGNAAALCAAMLRREGGRGSGGDRVPGLSPLLARGGGSRHGEAAVSRESLLRLFTPHLLLCARRPDQSEAARRTRWRIYGAVRLFSCSLRRCTTSPPVLLKQMAALKPPCFIFCPLRSLCYDNSDEWRLPEVLQQHLHPDLHFCQASWLIYSTLMQMTFIKYNLCCCLN